MFLWRARVTAFLDAHIANNPWPAERYPSATLISNWCIFPSSSTPFYWWRKSKDERLMVELFLLIQLRIAHLIKCDRKINVSLFGWVWSAKGSFIQHARTMFRIRTRIRHTVINWPLSQKLWRHWDWNALDFRIGSKFGLIRCSKGIRIHIISKTRLVTFSALSFI